MTCEKQEPPLYNSRKLDHLPEHYCSREEGHDGPHWCRFRHIWGDSDYAEAPASPDQHPATVWWRCGNQTPAFELGDLHVGEEYCALPAGHDGWHRADSGNQWRNEGGAA